MAEANTREAREAAWRARWRAEDFSWEGLARKPWRGWAVAPDGRVVEAEGAPEGSRAATLQDYWRDEAAHLIEGDGQQWTRAHCPLAWADGAPTPKANWGEAERAAFEARLSGKLGAAAETAFEGDWFNRQPVGADRRAQLRGCVLFRAPAHPQGAQSPLSVCFDLALFAEDARFYSATFSGYARFYSATFSGDARFESATFSGDARFDSATFIKEGKEGALGARHAVFRKPVFFQRVTFPKTPSKYSAAFRGARFEDVADFSGSGVDFIAALDEAMFEKKLLIDDPDEASAHRAFSRVMCPRARRRRTG